MKKLLTVFLLFISSAAFAQQPYSGGIAGQVFGSNGTASPPAFVLPPRVLLANQAGINMAITTDQQVNLNLPAGINGWIVQAAAMYNCSTSLAPATSPVGGGYTAPSKGGIAMINAAATYAGITTTGPNTAGSLGAIGTSSAWFNATINKMYFSLTTAASYPATCTLAIWGSVF